MSVIPQLRAQDDHSDPALLMAALNASASQEGAENGRILFTDRAFGMTLQMPSKSELRARLTQANVFRPFFTAKPRNQGNGLGLTTVHDILKRAGGQLRLKAT
jgi:C4-dicarboxylate-specific signal transduction histidine kinase